jgi:hypothetical protein
VGDHLGNDFGSSELGIQRANFPMRHPLSHGTRSSPSAPAGASCVCDRNRRFYLQPAKFTVARFDDVDTDRWPPGIAKGQQEMGACHGSNYRARPVGEAMQTEVIGRSVVRPFSVIAQSYDAERPPAAAMAPGVAVARPSQAQSGMRLPGGIRTRKCGREAAFHEYSMKFRP